MSIGPPFAPQAVIFDLDGLLIDSEGAWGRAERRVVDGLGLPWDERVRALMHGRGPQDAVAILASHLGDRHDPAELARSLLQAAEHEFAQPLDPRPGARELVSGLHGRLPIAVATNSLRRLADPALRGAGFDGCFTAVVCAEDVSEHKPAPDVYLAASRACDADPRRCVALEDSPVGVAAGKAAGMWVIGCPSFAGSPLPEADTVVDHLGQVDAVALARGRNGRSASG